jgi:hypothetical protein
VYLLQDNHGLALVYLMDQKEKVTSVKVICSGICQWKWDTEFRQLDSNMISRGLVDPRGLRQRKGFRFSAFEA